MPDYIDDELLPLAEQFKRSPLDLSGFLEELSDKKISSEMYEVLTQISRGDKLSFENIEYLLTVEADKDKEVLYKTADYFRRKTVGDVIPLRAIIEFSNYCRKSCSYCGINSTVKNLTRYRMKEDEIIGLAKRIKEETGIERLVLQSGEDLFWTKERIVRLVERIVDQLKMKVTLSIGERTREEYDAYRQAGASNYLLKIETTNPELFKSVHPDDLLTERLQYSKWLSELGYINGSGIIIGLPGQTISDIARDIQYFRDLEISMIGIGPFIPARGTLLEDCKPGSIDLTLKAIAAARIVCRRVFIPVTTALTTLSKGAQIEALKCGANVIMIGYTPIEYRKNYNIYNGKARVGIDLALEAIEKSNRKPPNYIKWGDDNAQP